MPPKHRPLHSAPKDSQSPLQGKDSQNHPKGRTLLSITQFTGLAIGVSTVFITIFLLIIDASGGWNMIFDGPVIVFNNVPLGQGEISILEALLVGFILSVLPIFLFLVFSATGIIILGGLTLAVALVSLAFLVPAGIFALPFVLVAGIVWLLRRKSAKTV